MDDVSTSVGIMMGSEFELKPLFNFLFLCFNVVISMYFLLCREQEREKSKHSKPYASSWY